jgi:hypothetical protein
MNQIAVNTVALNVYEFQDDEASTDIEQDFTLYSSQDSSVRHAIEYAKGLGMKVLLKPVINLRNGDPQSGIVPSSGWYTSYNLFIDRYAAIAQQEGVDLFCVGSGLDGTESDATDWQSVIQGVRSIYSGPLTYACDYLTYQQLTWWNSLDLIGINAYFPLMSADDPNPTQADMDADWQTVANSLTSWLKTSGLKKQILFTEVGYQSTAGANDQPGSLLTSGGYDPQVQEYCYQALFDNCLVKSTANTTLWAGPQTWFAGVMWWSWDIANPNGGGPGDIGYTPQGKPAQNVLQANYSGYVGSTYMNAIKKLKAAPKLPGLVPRKH